MAVLSPGPGRAGNAAPGFNLHPAPPPRGCFPPRLRGSWRASESRQLRGSPQLQSGVEGRRCLGVGEAAAVGGKKGCCSERMRKI